MPKIIFANKIMHNRITKGNSMKKSHLLSSLLTLLCVASCSCSVFHKGNLAEFDAAKQSKKENALNGKKFYYLGSSVTLGKDSGNEAIPEYLSAIDGISYQKEAVSGTTLRGNTRDDSYVARLINSKKFNKEEKIDAFFIQLSTNDASKKEDTNFGSVLKEKTTDMSKFDISTTMGAIEYIVNYVELIRNTKIFIYTNAYFDDVGKKSVSYASGKKYSTLVKLTSKLEEKYESIEDFDVTLIDLFNDEAFNNISNDDYELYMFDAIHPTKAGYLKWWTPFVEDALLGHFN